MALSAYDVRPAMPPRPKGMARASLALGLTGLPALPLFGLGLGLAVAGIVLGVIAAVRGAGRGTAITGIVMSLTTLAAGGMLISRLLSSAAVCADSARYPDDAATARCIEREFPFARGITPR